MYDILNILKHHSCDPALPGTAPIHTLPCRKQRRAHGSLGLDAFPLHVRKEINLSVFGGTDEGGAVPSALNSMRSFHRASGNTTQAKPGLLASVTKSMLGQASL